MNQTLPLAAPEGTRLALIEAGLEHFGRMGFAATSTRQLAATARTNIASISYHFGSKQGLRQACAEEIMRRIATAMPAAPTAPPATPAEAREALRSSFRNIAAYMIGGSDAGDIVPFMLRELNEGGGTLDTIYRRMMEPTHIRLCHLWGMATGHDPGSERVKLTVFSMIGQVMYFRIGARIVARRMDWSAIGPTEAGRIIELLLSNLDAALAAKGTP